MNPADWGPPQWVSIALLLLILVGIGTVYSQWRATDMRVDDLWDDVEKLRAEVARLREILHERGSTSTYEPPSGDRFEVVDAVEVEPVAETGPIVMLSPDDVPTTVTAIPSARPQVPLSATGPRPVVPPVPQASTGPQPVVPAVPRKRGRHRAS